MKPHGISRSSLTINHIWNARGRRPTLRRACKVFIPRDLRDLDMLRLPASYEEEHFVIQKLKTVTRHKHHHWILVAAISCYVYFGAIMFQYLEENHGAISPFNMTKPRERLVGSILNGSLGHKEYDEKEWVVHIRRAVLSHEALVLDAASQGYKGDRRKGERPHWSIQQSILFCFTVITTVGYGNIAPSTDAGRAVTIVYAFLGIPLMLMVLADLGKLFTKAIKFVFRYVRRFYRTGTFNKVKAAAKLHSDKPLQYMTVSWRTVSQDAPVGQKSASSGSLDSSYNQVTSLTLHNDELYKHLDSVNDDEVNHKHIEVEDEFNLPVTLAVAMVLVYMMVGAMLFAVWEEWSFFEAFYFVFISMSTVGFGDYVPMHQTYMMGAFAYLVLGLTLTSMCINVIQEKLSATFQKAKVRIGSTMGLDVNSLLREDHSRSKSFRSKSPELKKANGYRSKLSIQKESTCGSPSTPSSPNPGLDGSGSCGLGKEFLLNVPLQNRFKFYDSPYSTIHDDSGSSPSLRKLP